PVVISTGMATRAEVEDALAILVTNDVTMCICTSMYPTYIDNIHLNRLKSFPNWKKGFSTHAPDPILGVVAVAMGARYIEYHITLDREMKGSDHVCSLVVEEFLFMTENIKTILIALGNKDIPERLPKYLASTVKKLRKTKCEDGVYRVV
ncbi:MAG: N-acetylneuraminate synthase family protein, partial [Candidatus Hodarchaeales archaeon]